MTNINGLILTLLTTVSIVGVSGAGLSTAQAFEAPRSENTVRPVLAETEMLEQVGAKILAVNKETGVAYAQLSSDQEMQLSRLNHAKGRCAGFEALSTSFLEPASFVASHVFGQLKQQAARNARFHPSALNFESVQQKPEIQAAIDQVSATNLRTTVEFLSSFPNRYNRDGQPNVAIEALRGKIEAILKTTSIPYKIDFISHNSTQQNSLRVHLDGAKRPSEILVFGAHADSINQSWSSTEAPGADDNASGSSNLVEALRILVKQPRLERSVEFFWYAGEESGLLGSAEIAKDYKDRNVDVITVLQLDMTLHPGDGELNLGSMTDFTSAWFRSYFETINSVYIKAKIMDDQCGYGCSDHASWFRQGYATLMPFESSFDNMNHKLHTADDVINSMSSFEHSAIFSRIVLAIAMDLGNSTLRATP
jgi:bacterial leucyl aminopeptidase